MLYNLFENRDFVSVFAVALLAEGVDRNPMIRWHRPGSAWSPSSRRAWIEITGRSAAMGFVGSPSSRRAWIEIGISLSRSPAELASPSSRRAWIEIEHPRVCRQPHESPSSRRAWIEFFLQLDSAMYRVVALLAEGVDRNLLSTIVRTSWRVALLAEGVDRNRHVVSYSRAFSSRPPRGGRG